MFSYFQVFVLAEQLLFQVSSDTRNFVFKNTEKRR